MRFIIVSGLSGSGKSIALDVLEDLDYYCIDNLPIGLLPALVKQLEAVSDGYYQNAAVGIDARNLVEDFAQLPSMLKDFAAQGLKYEIFFLSADDNTLLKRFSETRRKHPLSSAETSLSEAIEMERELLVPLSDNADWIIDTSRFNVHQLRSLVRERVAGKDTTALSLLFISFGYKHGLPMDADFIFDIRCLPNPHWDPVLRPRTGLEAQVKNYLESEPMVDSMYQEIKTFLERWIPKFEAENRNYMTVALGCTGGQHRSVYMAQRLLEHFSKQQRQVLVRHRDMI